MTEIEELVRQALAETPTANTTTDPLAALDRRVRKARRWLAAGTGAAAAAVVAAVVVPIAVLSGGNGTANTVIVGHSPTPSPSSTPVAVGPPGTEVLWTNGAVSVSDDSGGTPWLLSSSGHGDYVNQVGGGNLREGFKVQSPADYLVAGDTVIWVVGNGDGAGTMSRITALDPSTGALSTSTFSARTFGDAAVVGDTLYVTTSDGVDRMDAVNGIQQRLATVPAPGEIAASQNGHLWVRSGSNKLVELVPTQTGMNVGATVDWPGDVYGPTGVDSNGDDMWAYDGRIIGLTPKNLLGCISCAEGWRLSVGGRPSSVVTARDGSVFAAVPQASAAGKRAGLDAGVYYYSPQSVHSGGGSSDGQLFGVAAVAVVADPRGGVDYLDQNGALYRWNPTVATASPATR